MRIHGIQLYHQLRHYSQYSPVSKGPLPTGANVILDKIRRQVFCNLKMTSWEFMNVYKVVQNENKDLSLVKCSAATSGTA